MTSEGSEMLAEPAPYATYRRRLAEGRIAYQRCASCAESFFYPRVLCPSCGSTDVTWQDSAGRGTVYSTTVVPQRDADPYVVCLVDLAEGFRMMSTVLSTPPEEVAIGDAVQGRVEADGESARVVFEKVAR